MDPAFHWFESKTKYFLLSEFLRYQLKKSQQPPSELYVAKTQNLANYFKWQPFPIGFQTANPNW